MIAHRRWMVYGTVWAVGLMAGTLAVPTYAAFTGSTSNTANRFVAAPDWVAPNVSASAIRKAGGGVAGYIKQGGGYFVYANVSDAGNPASGTTSVTADVSAITSGQTAVALASGSWTVDGISFGYRSAQLTANGVLVDGAKPYTISTQDGAANTRTVGGWSVGVDNVVPAGSDIQAENSSGGTVGRAEQGDTVIYTFTERIEPDSVIAGWSGSATNVVVRFNNSAVNDVVQIWNAGNSSQLPLGEVNTQGNYVKAHITFGASGTPSTMVQTGSTITITLGTVSDASELNTNGIDTQLWTPSSGATDLAGNPCSVSVISELGLNDPDF